jgi:alpha-glucosidase
MKNKFFILLLLCLIIFYRTALSQNTPKGVIPEMCESVVKFDDRIVFNCNNNITVSIKVIDNQILQIHYSQNNFNLKNKSFAVIDSVLSETVSFGFAEQPDSYEIYTAKLIIRVNKSPFKIRVFDKWQKLLTEDYDKLGCVIDSPHISCNKLLKKDERIYGLGEKNGSLIRNGAKFKMWNSDKPCYSVDEDPLYKSIPFFMSSEGYGIFFDNTYKSEFEFGVKNREAYSFSAPGGELLYYVLYGSSFKQIISAYTRLTGRPIMPPAWALGFSQCRGLLTTEKLTREIAQGYRSRKIPCDVIYQDIGWTQHLQDFEWRKENYENPVKMLSDLRKDGFKVIVSQDPVISKANKKQWDEADSLGLLTIDIRSGKAYDMPWPWGGECGVVDFTKPETADWWGTYQQKAIDDGVMGFWTDMGEPAWSNEENTDRLFMKHHLGMHDEIHNVYGLTWDKVVTEQFEKRNPDKRIFQMTRAAYAGMQKYTFGWSGDAGNGNTVEDGWELLASQIPLALSSGLGLIPFWSCDISGYCGDIKDYGSLSELYIRWLQFGAFNSLSRIHHEGNNAVEPWLFGEEAEEICKSAIELKYRLFPYIYSYSHEAYDTGWPIMRPLFFEFPSDKETYNLSSQFLFGKELLIAPVVEEGAAIKRIYLPKGEWIDYHNKLDTYQGSQWIDYPVNLSTIPVFIKRGTIVPEMPVMQYINEHPNYNLIVRVLPALTNREASFSIYEDDWESNNYKKDICGFRDIICKTTKTTYDINYSESVRSNFKLTERNIIYKVYLEKKPSKVKISGKKLKQSMVKDDCGLAGQTIKRANWSWDNKNKTCIIQVPSNQILNTIIIEK